MTVRELYKRIDAFCPRELSCSWDNDGVMVSGGLDNEVKKVLLALDATLEVVEYAIENGFDTVITHHPMLFRGAKSVSEDTLVGKKIVRALSCGVSVLSFHTRLDACDGGVNDALANKLGLEVSGKFGDEESPSLGRICDITPMPAIDFAKLVKEKLGCDMVRLNGKTDSVIKKVALCGGDGKDFVYPALKYVCDAFVTGDSGYNMSGDATEEGIVTIEAGHYHTEAPVLEILEKLVCEACNAEVVYYNSCTYSIV